MGVSPFLYLHLCLSVRDIDLSKHAVLRAAWRTTHTNTHTNFSVPDNQQHQTGHQGQVQYDVNVFHHSLAEEGVIVFPQRCHGYTVSTGRISTVKH